MTDDKQYLLVIKRKNNDFLSIEWNLTSLYKGENLNSLEGIDSFTRTITRKELIQEALDKNIVDPNEEFEKLAIIYNSNNKTRELKEGTIFKEDNIIYSEDDLIKFIIKNISNKRMLNKIYNLCNFKDNIEEVEKFKYIINNIDTFTTKGPNALKAALSIFKDIPYNKKRTIILRITDKIVMNMSDEEIDIKSE